MGFFGAMFGGSNPTLDAGMKQAGDTSQFATSKGKQLTSLAGDWTSSLLGGDPAKISKLLAPQIGTIQKQGEQQKNTMSQFGNRSGGMNAAGQTMDDNTRTSVNNMVSSLTSGALNNAGSMGSSLLNTGMESLKQQTDMSQLQMQNWKNSIFGGLMKTGIDFAATAGLGGIAGAFDPNIGFGKGAESAMAGFLR